MTAVESPLVGTVVSVIEVGNPVAVIESMKMEHLVVARETMHQIGLDRGRPEAVAKRHAQGRRTARENIADLVDDGSFIEFGALAIAAQRSRRDVRELVERTPADGLVGGIATINAPLFGTEATECVVASYDYMVLAGTQGMTNHLKKDRLFDLASRRDIPVVLYTEGGGGRPGDVDVPGVSSLDCFAF